MGDRCLAPHRNVHIVPTRTGTFRLQSAARGATAISEQPRGQEQNGAKQGEQGVECDGDRFHSIETVADDMARQAVLERVGWRFVRIRGSQFFRDPDSAMKPVFETLSELGIQPEGDAEFSCSPTPGDLVDRVKRRASEILREMEKD